MFNLQTQPQKSASSFSVGNFQKQLGPHNDIGRRHGNKRKRQVIIQRNQLLNNRAPVYSRF